MTRFQRIFIEAVGPCVDGGRYPAKTAVGEQLPVRATVWREGDRPVTVVVRWTSPDGRELVVPMSPAAGDQDVWQASVTATVPGAWSFQIEARGDVSPDQSAAVGAEERSDVHAVYADRARATFGAWYELFPRSTGGWDAQRRPVHGTFATAAADLPRIAAMGFDVVYLTPIHPIGQLRRKGRGNTPVAQPGDPGCPWAIGSAEGGHDAICPQLGSVADFRAYVAAVRDLGMEVALELALQCAPDHPWLSEHPDWFAAEGAGPAEQGASRGWTDIRAFNFDRDPEGLYEAIRRIVDHWIGLGVQVFRVDNPHTKPAGLWHRLIWDLKRDHPDLVLLAEAFTRPAVQRGLSKLGFTQTYTYFMWRDRKQELVTFGEELARNADFMRPNLFPSNHDVLPPVLHHQGPGMFAIRAALAATFSPSWGIYSGYEICENEPASPGGYAPADAEKYRLYPRDFAGAYAAGRDIAQWIGLLNQIRRRRPALRQLRTLRFHPVDDDALIAYSKVDPVTGDAVLCVVALDPDRPRRGIAEVSPADLGLRGQVRLLDEVSGQERPWESPLSIDLDPSRAVAVIYRVIPKPQEQP